MSSVLAPNIAFDAVYCAELHNQLLARAIHVSNPLGPAPKVKRDFIPRLQKVAPHWPNHVEIEPDSLIYQFLSMIDSYQHMNQTFPLTPEMLQPDPTLFDSVLHTLHDDRNIILLYPQNRFSEPEDGGLYFDLDTNLVCWGHMQIQGLQSEGFWVPLEVALKESWYMWERGKYYWDSALADTPAFALSCRGWVTKDVDEAIANWEHLLNAIHKRLPEQQSQEEDGSQSWLLDPLSMGSLEHFRISSFAKVFLSRAKRPLFTYVAPGITTFSEDTFAHLYHSEDSEAWRCINPEAGEEYSSLLLPATSGKVPDDVTQTNPAFDKNWGSSKKTVSRNAGLYIDMNTNGLDSDCIWLLTADGVDDAVQYVGQRPWGPPRGIKLAELFLVWKDLIEQEVWRVGADGVITPHDWFTDVETEDFRRLLWVSNVSERP